SASGYQQPILERFNAGRTSFLRERGASHYRSRGPFGFRTIYRNDFGNDEAMGLWRRENRSELLSRVGQWTAQPRFLRHRARRFRRVLLLGGGGHRRRSRHRF